MHKIPLIFVAKKIVCFEAKTTFSYLRDGRELVSRLRVPVRVELEGQLPVGLPQVVVAGVRGNLKEVVELGLVHHGDDLNTH